MKENLVNQIVESINAKGHNQVDTRLNRHTRALNGHTITHHYLEGIDKLPQIKDKYNEDWKRMYPSYRNACDELIKDKNTRRAIIFNMSHYYDMKDEGGEVIREGTYPCFVMLQIVHRENGFYDCIVFQRSSDVVKLVDDITFFEWVIVKIQRRAKINIDKINIHYGSLHYTTNQ
jgi:hypothetical protein